MSEKGVSMRKIMSILRLHFEAKLSNRQIARSLTLSVGVVNKYIGRAVACGLSWPLPEEIDEQALLALLKPTTSITTIKSSKYDIDFAKVHQELKGKGITLQLLWEEYSSGELKPLSYSRYCFHYRVYQKKLKRSMRQIHKAGDKVFIDYSGKRFDLIDPDTGEVRPSEIFVGVLGASNYTFAEATWTQQLPDFLASQRRMFEFFGGVPALVVPDNLKSAVTKSCRYEPDINPTYAKFIEHYLTAVLPARPYRPKDKPKAELGVQLVQRWILAKLRYRTFIGLAELNDGIKKLLAELNQKPFQKLPGCRLSVFLEVDQPALKGLPEIAYEYRDHKVARAGIDYHVELARHYYSVPHQYCGEKIDLWFNQYTVECYINGKQIATHLYSPIQGKYSTIGHHMPKGHLKQSQYSKERFMHWAGDIGPHAQIVIEQILESKLHPEQAYRSCLGLLSLNKKYGAERLENACRYGCDKNAYSRKSILSILEKNLDQSFTSAELILDLETTSPKHENIRGAHYYH
jgi:transposase